MKIARTILAPLLAFAFLLTQTAPFADAQSPAKPAGCCCHQAACCCAQTPANPNSAPRPAAPVRIVTHDLRIVAAVIEQMFSSAAPSRPSVFRPRPSLEASPIPLYQRNCMLLI